MIAAQFTGDERLVAAAARDVDGARDELLAGAGLARDEDGRVGGRDPHDAVEHARASPRERPTMCSSP